VRLDQADRADVGLQPFLLQDIVIPEAFHSVTPSACLHVVHLALFIHGLELAEMF
jgi:hypothetical protein